VKNEKYKNAYKLYNQGMSLAQVGKVIGVTRQAVYEAFRVRGYVMRKKKFLPVYVYNGRKFTINHNGYYRSTDRKGTHLLHRYVWETERGAIPDSWDIHHIDEDKTNNKINNLECLPKAEHTRKYSPHHNQHKNKNTLHLYEKTN
jgi:hypothetical protein